MTEHSPALQQKIVYAGTSVPSFGKASELLDNLAELAVNAKKVERLCHDIGQERIAQRDEAEAAFVALPLSEKFKAPVGVKPPPLAVVMPDGGRLQRRERLESTVPTKAQDQLEPSEFDFEEPSESDGYWREYKAGLLLQMTSQSHKQDPCPEVPAGFLDLLRIPILARQIGKVAAGVATEPTDLETDVGEQQLPQESEYEPPQVQQRQVVATLRRWRDFAVSLATKAHAAGFQEAKRKAFVADGSANNWRLWARFFGSFTPVLDFIHALSYVYAAATAGCSLTEGWECYKRWIAWAWQGEVTKVIEELRPRQEQVGLPKEGESKTSVASILTRALGYLENQKEKMKYDEYRQAGLPITSSHVESVMKQMNYRVKGTEKFWDRGAEPMVQLRADLLSDDKPLEDFWEQRQANATGQRRYRRAG